jgi:outer membrane receptor protein involved in Fe transport
VPSQDYFDLFAEAQIDGFGVDELTLRAGVENLTDEEPPLLPSWTGANTDPAQYDVLGRRFYLNASIRF